jgi:hypothetical protein
MARDKASKFLLALPVDYRGDALACQDEQTPLGRALTERMHRLTSDLGGVENVSDILCSEVRDFIVLDLLVDAIRTRMTAGEPIDAAALCQIINTKLGLARMLGLARKAKRVRSLQEVMAGAA